MNKMYNLNGSEPRAYDLDIGNVKVTKNVFEGNNMLDLLYLSEIGDILKQSHPDKSKLNIKQKN